VHLATSSWGSCAPRQARAWLLFLLCALLWAAFPQFLRAQQPPLPTESEPTASKPSVSHLIQLLRQADSLLTISENNLAQRTQQVSELQGNLQKVEQSLADWKSESDSLIASLVQVGDSQAQSLQDLSAMQNLYDELTKRFKTLSESQKAYQAEMQGQILSLEGERNWWRALVLGASGALLVDIVIRLVMWIASLIG
jgi:hypothetical protein